MKTNESIADGILEAMNSAGGGTDGWERLEYQGDDRYLGLDAICEVARIVERLIRNGDASPEMILAARHALLAQEPEDDATEPEPEPEPAPEDRILAGETDRECIAAVIDGASDGDRFAILGTAAGILADLVRDDVVRLAPRDLDAIREAVRIDWAKPLY